MVRLSTLSMTLGQSTPRTGYDVRDDEEEDDDDDARNGYMRQASHRSARGRHRREKDDEDLADTRGLSRTRSRRYERRWRRLFTSGEEGLEPRSTREEFEQRGRAFEPPRHRSRHGDEAYGHGVYADETEHRRRRHHRQPRVQRPVELSEERVYSARHPKITNFLAEYSRAARRQHGEEVARRRPTRSGHARDNPTGYRAREHPRLDLDRLGPEDFEKLQMCLQIIRPNRRLAQEELDDYDGRHEHPSPALLRLKKNKVAPLPVDTGADDEVASKIFPPLPPKPGERPLELGGSFVPPPSTKRQSVVDSDDELTCREGVVKFLVNSSLPSFRVFGGPSDGLLRRLFWAIILAIGIGLVALIWVRQMRKLMNYRTMTTTHAQSMTSLPFPAVTVCNLNAFRQSFENERNSTSAQPIQTLAKYFNHVEVLPNSSLQEVQYGDDEILQAVRQGAHRLEDMFTNCQFGGAQEECDNLFVQALTDAGVCYTFNSAEYIQKYGAKMAAIGGVGQGLDVVINVEVDEYGGQSDVGIKVLVHEAGVPEVNQKGLVFGAGNHVYMAIQKHKYVAMPSPYGTCMDTQSNSFSNPLKRYKKYSQVACEAECRVSTIVGSCGCKMFYEQGNFRICSTIDDIACVQTTLASFSPATNCSCKKECQYVQYKTTWSSARYPGPVLAASMATNMNTTVEKIKTNFLRLSVYFDDLVVREVVERPEYDAYDFICDMSAVLCFLVGLTFSTILELLELLIASVARGCCCGDRKRRRTERSLGDTDA